MNESIVSSEDQKLFLDKLRQTTAPSHKELEENFYSKSILDPSVTLQDYQTYIAKLYGVTLACEQDIFPAITSVLPDCAERYKASFIADDLVNTGLSLIQVANLPVYKFTFSSIAQAMGIMYVLEGSTLGGKFLYKHINKTLGLDSVNGASYFWGYGPQTGSKWNTFISVMANYAIDKNCESEIISSAVHTFSTIDNWLRQAETN